MQRTPVALIVDDEADVREFLEECVVAQGYQPLSAASGEEALRLLEKVVATKEEQIDVIAEVLARHEPGYERDPSKKIQLINHLGGLKQDRVAPLCVPYLEDMDEGVRYAAAETLLRQGNETSARLPLLDHFVSSSEDSLRIRILVAEGFVERGWTVAEKRAEVEKLLPDAYQIDAPAKAGGVVRLKKKSGAKE